MDTFWSDILDAVKSGDVEKRRDAYGQAIEKLNPYIHKFVNMHCFQFPSFQEDVIQNGQIAVINGLNKMCESDKEIEDPQRTLMHYVRKEMGDYYRDATKSLREIKWEDIERE